MIRLKITRPGTLLSVLIDREITETQLSIITEVLADGGLTYGEFIQWQARRAEGDYDAPVGAGESVEAFRG